MGAEILSAALCLTNLAGHVITATPIGLDGPSVVFVQAATTSTVALAAFPATEQTRIRRMLGKRTGQPGGRPLPPGLEGLRTIYADELARAEARRAGGVMAEEAFRQKANRVQRAWEHSLEKKKYGLSDEERAYWKGHLR